MKFTRLGKTRIRNKTINPGSNAQMKFLEMNQLKWFGYANTADKVIKIKQFPEVKPDQRPCSVY